MQGQRSIFDPFPETVDLNQGSNNSMDEADDWNNMLSLTERQLLNNDLSNELNFRSWDVGESSSRASLQGQVSNNGQSWSNSASRDSRLELQQHESSAFHQVNTQRPVSNRVSMNVNLNVGFEATDSDDDGMGRYSEYGSGSSLDNWGLSCKRKSLEGTSTQTLGVGSSCFPETSRSLNISSPLVNSVSVNRHEPPNTRIEVQESSPTHFGIRGSLLNNNINNNIRHPNGNSSHQSSSRQLLLNEFLDRGQVGNHSNQQPPLTHVPNIPRNAYHFPWGSNTGSRSRSSSSLLRNNVQMHNFVPPSESRNSVQDPTNWSLATGGSGGSSGGSRGFNGVWAPQRNNHAAPSQQRSSEFPPWTLFPSSEVEYGGHRGHFSQFSGGSSSTSEDNHIQRRNYPSFSRSALLMEVPGDDWRALAADIEGRQRLVSEIRQVLNAMRRGENLRAEDYMLFDPFINGVAELHDRHRDMRLDVDNMSYEELLALEERIGNVNTGLSEEVILKSMKQRKHIAFMAISTPNLEPCCICQEDYDTGENIGSLDCGHDFHTDCIKQWLAQKNTCPICKMPGLAT
ncbi:putative transcription factor C2H2 family [Helianthus annuus]|nr:putative transcription factor C2H2 family [Helianthus annuus]